MQSTVHSQLRYHTRSSERALEAALGCRSSPRVDGEEEWAEGVLTGSNRQWRDGKVGQAMKNFNNGETWLGERRHEVGRGEIEGRKELRIKWAR
jgi:hypothetical protein